MSNENGNGNLPLETTDHIYQVRRAIRNITAMADSRVMAAVCMAEAGALYKALVGAGLATEEHVRDVAQKFIDRALEASADDDDKTSIAPIDDPNTQKPH